MFKWGNANLANATGVVLSQIRLRAASAVNTYKTAQLNADWAVAEGFHLLVGGDIKKYGFTTTYLQRSNGTTSAQDTNVACCTLAGDTLDKFGHVVSIEGQSFFDSDYFAADDYFHFGDPTVRGGAFKLGPEPGLSSNNSVDETDKAAFFQANFTSDLGGATLRGDAGVRYIHTEQTANGYGLFGGVVTPITTFRAYDDWLPSVKPGARAVAEVPDPRGGGAGDGASRSRQPRAGRGGLGVGRQPHRDLGQPQPRSLSRDDD